MGRGKGRGGEGEWGGGGEGKGRGGEGKGIKGKQRILAKCTDKDSSCSKHLFDYRLRFQQMTLIE